MRLQSFLSKSGVTSRRKAADLVRAGGVTVNGAVVKEPGFAIDPAKDEVLVAGSRPAAHEKLYYLFHKPRGVVTTMRDTHGRKTVADFFRSVPARLFPVGRLDKDTTGLLIMTNDGDFANRLIHPSRGVEKVYEAVTPAPLGPGKVRNIEKGLEVEGRLTAPCRVQARGRRGNGFLYEVTLHEGRKRQIRDMFKIVGAQITALHRARIGKLELGGLRPGSWRRLSENEIRLFLDPGK